MKAQPVLMVPEPARLVLLNVIYTLAGQDFRSHVDKLVDKRHIKIAEQRQLYIELDPEIAEVFN